MEWMVLTGRDYLRRRRQGRTPLLAGCPDAELAGCALLHVGSDQSASWTRCWGARSTGVMDVAHPAVAQTLPTRDTAKLVHACAAFRTNALR